MDRVGKRYFQQQYDSSGVAGSIGGPKQGAKYRARPVAVGFGRKRTADAVRFLDSLPRTTQGAINLYKMEPLGEGGTQVIYKLPSSDHQFVIKVNLRSMELKPKERADKYKSYVDSYTTLHRHFGDHCTLEKLMLTQVTTSSNDKEAIVSIAEFEPGFGADTKQELNSRPFVWKIKDIIENKEIYDAMHKVLFSNEGDYDLDTILRVNPSIKPMADLIQEDAQFKEVLIDFLKQFQLYFSQTGQLPDIRGVDNIIFFKTFESAWTYKLGTVIKDEPTMINLLKSLESLKSNRAEFQRNFKLNFPARACVEYIRALNSLSQIAGMGNVVGSTYSEPLVQNWQALQETGVTQPVHLEVLIAVYQCIQQSEASQLEGALDKLGLSFTESLSEYTEFVESESDPDKKLALALYLHKKIPQDSQFARYRHTIAKDIIKNSLNSPQANVLVRGCLGAVLTDPSAPESVKKEVQKQME